MQPNQKRIGWKHFVNWHTALFIALVTLFAVSCTPSPTPTPTPAVPPTNTPPPSATVTLTHTPVPPTNTPVPPTSTPQPEDECDRADLDGSGRVTVLDVVEIATNLGSAKKHYDARYDINLDGKVSAKDLVIVVKCRNEQKHG